jgi:hypothetical protein
MQIIVGKSAWWWRRKQAVVGVRIATRIHHFTIVMISSILCGTSLNTNYFEALVGTGASVRVPESSQSDSQEIL